MSYKTNEDYAALKSKEFQAYSKFSRARDIASQAENEWRDSMHAIDDWLAANATWQVFELVEKEGAKEKKPLEIGTYEKCQDYLVNLRKEVSGNLNMTYRDTGKKYFELEVVESSWAHTTVTRTKYLIEAL